VILVDSSAWFEFERGSNSDTDVRLQSLIGGNAPLACSEPILMEVLAGARSDVERVRLRRVLTSFGWVSVDVLADFEAAAKVYADCRAVGITPRGLIDCMIAAIAMRSGSSLLTADRDFTAMADVLPLRLA
jgi:predicted nucleic acid-binding protein